MLWSVVVPLSNCSKNRKKVCVLKNVCQINWKCKCFLDFIVRYSKLNETKYLCFVCIRLYFMHDVRARALSLNRQPFRVSARFFVSIFHIFAYFSLEPFIIFNNCCFGQKSSYCLAVLRCLTSDFILIKLCAYLFAHKEAKEINHDIKINTHTHTQRRPFRAPES